jgi:hypothetical protein
MAADGKLGRETWTQLGRETWTQLEDGKLGRTGNRDAISIHSNPLLTLITVSVPTGNRDAISIHSNPLLTLITVSVPGKLIASRFPSLGKLIASRFPS